MKLITALDLQETLDALEDRTDALAVEPADLRTLIIRLDKAETEAIEKRNLRKDLELAENAVTNFKDKWLALVEKKNKHG